MLNLVIVLCFPAAVAFLLESITPGAPPPSVPPPAQPVLGFHRRDVGQPQGLPTALLWGSGGRGLSLPLLQWAPCWL